MTTERHHATRAVRASVGTDRQHGAVMPPVYLSSNYTFDGFDGKREYDYTRSGNPTRDNLGTAIADLEGGAGGIVTSSGMAALTLICHLLRPEDLLLAPHDCYGGTYRLLDSLARKGHFRVEFVDQTSADALNAAFARGPKVVLVETPSNPLLRIVDIEAVSRRASRCGALLVADNTFLSPALQTPLELGADVVVHSTTKYLNGHSDVVGGAVVAKDPELHEELAWWANCLGLTGSPFDSYLTLRGLRTLSARLEQHQRNAGRLVGLLADHPAIARVYYPGLDTHPGHAIAARQQRGFGAMISAELVGDTFQVRKLLDNLRLFTLAESLGGVESLVAHPATMTHAAMEPKARHTAGIGDTLIRFSVGIENADDLAGDLRQALDAVRDSLEANSVRSIATGS